MKKQQKKAKGFTIVEVTLAMLFLSVLITAIASLIVRAAEIYQKGLIMRSVNALGSEIMDNIARTSSNTSNDSYSWVDTDGNGRISLDEQTEAYEKYFIQDTTDHYQNYGLYCTGNQSYIWNTARTFREENRPQIAIVNNGADTNPDIKTPRLISVYDPRREICSIARGESTGWNTEPGGNVELELPNPDGAGPMENIDKINQYVTPIIQENESKLYLYELIVMPETNNVLSKQTFTSINFILGTIKGVNITAANDYCHGEGFEETSDETGLSEEYNSSGFSYCAVNKFNFAIRTGGKINEEG